MRRRVHSQPDRHSDAYGSDAGQLKRRILVPWRRRASQIDLSLARVCGKCAGGAHRSCEYPSGLSHFQLVPFYNGGGWVKKMKGRRSLKREGSERHYVWQMSANADLFSLWRYVDSGGWEIKQYQSKGKAACQGIFRFPDSACLPFRRCAPHTRLPPP